MLLIVVKRATGCQRLKRLEAFGEYRIVTEIFVYVFLEAVKFIRDEEVQLRGLFRVRHVRREQVES